MDRKKREKEKDVFLSFVFFRKRTKVRGKKWMPKYLVGEKEGEGGREAHTQKENKKLVDES